MCIRDRAKPEKRGGSVEERKEDRLKRLLDLVVLLLNAREPCLLYTSDAADERSSVDLGGRRIIKKQTTVCTCRGGDYCTTQHNHKL